MLLIINKSQCYLQAITESDLTSSNGTHITTNSCNGTLQHGRPSRYDWPTMLFEPGGWRCLQDFLCDVAPYRKLIHPLSTWLVCVWRKLLKTGDFDSTHLVNVICGMKSLLSPENSYFAICPALNSNLYSNRWRVGNLGPSGHPWALCHFQKPIILNRGHKCHYLFHYIARTNPRWPSMFKTANWRHIGDIKIPANTAMSELISSSKNSTATCVCDGSMKKHRRSHTWIHSSIETFVWLEGAWPADGNPTTMSSYPPEL